MAREKNVKIIFWGTPEFAVPAFEALVNNGYSVVAAITNPDEPSGRKQTLTPPPAKVWAEKHGVPVLQPQKLEIGNWKLEIPAADLYVVAAYGKIIPKEILEIPKYGTLNVHPSLLPRWRGPSPIQYTILEGDAETGVTIMLVDEKMDHGPILARQELEILNPKPEVLNKFKTQNLKITYKELHDELAKLGAELLIDTLPKWVNGEITPVPQDEAKATYSKMLKKEDGKIDWTLPAERIERQIRAFEVWPGSYTFWQRGKNRIRLEIEKAEAVSGGNSGQPTGFVIRVNDRIIVRADKGGIALLQVKPEGKKSLSAKEFLNGYGDIIGAMLR